MLNCKIQSVLFVRNCSQLDAVTTHIKYKPSHQHPINIATTTVYHHIVTPAPPKYLQGVIIKIKCLLIIENIRREDGRRMKGKRIRTIFTPEQLERMEDEFNKYWDLNNCITGHFV